jgi:hypothetical protein
MLKDKWFNKNFQNLALSSLLLALCCILYPDTVSSGPYINSAHGNSAYGVNRTSLTFFSYSKGNCVHCHEQHASIGGSEPNPTGGPDKYALFYTNHVSQTDNCCFKCHTDLSSFQIGGLINRSYSYRAGGYTADTLNDIKEAFSFTAPATSHNLGDIRTFIYGRWGYTTDSNPCAACHNPHMAKGDPANSPNSSKSSVTRGYSPVSRPSLHSKDNNVWGLWGDAVSERMNMYASSLGGIYQAPYAASGYEPDGSVTQDGSNLTDFDTFCIDCHNNSNTIYSNVLGRNLYKFNFANEMHGGFAATYCSYNVPPPTSLLYPPYDGLTKCGQYALSCTDCHEPHGSPNNYLVRKQVNKGIVTVTQYGAGDSPEGGERFGKEWLWLCEKCHTGLRTGDGLTPHHNAGSGLSCTKCHPGGNYRNCTDCHFHGNNSIDGTPYKGGKPLF